GPLRIYPSFRPRCRFWRTLPWARTPPSAPRRWHSPPENPAAAPCVWLALRERQPGDLLFTAPAKHLGRLLDFQVDCASDAVQTEVFGPKVKCAKSDTSVETKGRFEVAQ